MSTPAFKSPSKSTARDSSCEYERKRPSRPQSVDRFTEEVGDARSGKAGDGGDLSILIDSPLPSQVSPIISDQPSKNRGSVQRRETGGGVDLDLPIETKASIVATETPSIAMFQGSSNFQISHTNITPIGGDATIIQFGDGQFTDVQRNLICDYIATLAALPDIHDNLKEHTLIQLIINLPRAEAVFNDYQNKKKSGPCFDGTRVALLREMANWATGTDQSRMYILSGLAGIGKSTVAYTIASRAADLNLLGASFFFSRDEADRNNAKKLFTTIAYQLCVYNESFAEAIGDALRTKRGSAATTKDPQEQLQVLILDPLRNIVQSHTRPTLVIVDALDECDDDDVDAVVEGLSQLVRDLPSFKVILTTRPLPYLDDFLLNHDHHKLFHLQDIEDKVVDSDIKLYLKHNLSLEKVRTRFRRRKWFASDEQIDTLVRAAGRLFIIASTAVRYILDKSVSDPAAQMEELLRAYAHDHTPFKDLNDFYTIVLRNVVPANCDNQIILNRYRSIVGAIVCVSRPLPVSTLARLIDMDVEDIYLVLEKLQSVILLGDDDVPQIYHKSFPDYLTDQTRCKGLYLRIDAMIGHAQMAKCCFDITNKHLKYNILGFTNVARFMTNEDGLEEDKITDEQLQEKIPPHLRYACIYWANHFEVAKIEDTELMKRLEIFVDEHTLHWLEVLSLIKKLDLAHRVIRIIIKLLKSTSSNLHQLLSDALPFISKFYDIIKRSALHTYYSALPFSPTKSLLYRRYIKEAEDNICRIEGGPENWDAIVALRNPGGKVNDIRFSLNGSLFVSYTEQSIGVQGELWIWDGVTGTPVSTIQGDKFAITNDFSTVVSSSDNIITFYNVNGSTKGIMITTSSRIEALALSESSRVAALLSDGTVWLWDSRNAEIICSFEDGFRRDKCYQCTFRQYDDHHRVLPLQFSPTGARLAYVSADATVVTLLNGSSGKFIADLPIKHVPMFGFSADGSRIACLSALSGLTLWNTESGGLVSAVSICHYHALAISANGSLLATSVGIDVALWSENRDHLAKIKHISTEERDMAWMAFSLNNILAIGIIPNAIKLYNTKTDSFISTLSFSGPSTALAFSPDCTHLACGSEHGNVYLWDMQRIDDSSLPTQEATVVTAIALSQDCSRLVCGFEHGEVELWETSPTKREVHLWGRSLTERRSWFECRYKITTVEFGPDGRLFASGSDDGTIQLWNGRDGSFRGTLTATDALGIVLDKVALSNSVLVAVGSKIFDRGLHITLWSLDTLCLIHTLSHGYETTALAVSISDDSVDDSVLVAIAEDSHFRHDTGWLFDVICETIRATPRLDSKSHKLACRVHKLKFLSDKSRIVAQTSNGDYLCHIKKKPTQTKGPMLIQFPDTPLWHGVPLQYYWDNEWHCILALFPPRRNPVPVLWIPDDIRVKEWTQSSSMFALGCDDGRIILLRLPTSHNG